MTPSVTSLQSIEARNGKSSSSSTFSAAVRGPRIRSGTQPVASASKSRREVHVSPSGTGHTAVAFIAATARSAA